MNNLNWCIVKNQKFELVKTEGAIDKNCVLVLDSKNSSYNKYELLNGIVVKINFYFTHDRNFPSSYAFDYKDIEILKGDTNWKSLLDFLNEYSSYSKEKLDNIVVEIQKKEKSKLELDIEKLKKQQSFFENKINIYKQVDRKYEEIKKLLLKLEE